MGQVERTRRWRAKNPHKMEIYNRTYYKKHGSRHLKRKDYMKVFKLKHLYGLTIEDYRNLYEKQKGVCAICSRKLKLNVDHNHFTKEVRGLLCHRCNNGLHFLEDIKWTEKATSYLITCGLNTRTVIQVSSH